MGKNKFVLPDFLDSKLIRNPSDYKEIHRLAKMLANAGYTIDLHRAFDGWQIWVMEPKISVIEHFGSYGSQDDLVEIGFLLNERYGDVEGHLSAEEAFKIIEKETKAQTAA